MGPVAGRLVQGQSKIPCSTGEGKLQQAESLGEEGHPSDDCAWNVSMDVEGGGLESKHPPLPTEASPKHHSSVMG